MYSGSKYLFSIIDVTTQTCRPRRPTGRPRQRTLRSNNNKTSGGFPHSDIRGSKPVPGSPRLNAGYHVLHRLLLPRHPPNALFALDLIRKEQGPRSRDPEPASLRRRPTQGGGQVARSRRADMSKASYFPMSHPEGQDGQRTRLGTISPPSRSRDPQHPLTRGRRRYRCCFSLNDVKPAKPEGPPERLKDQTGKH